MTLIFLELWHQPCLPGLCKDAHVGAVPAIKRDKGLVLVTAVAHLTWRINRFFPCLVDFYNRREWR